MKIDAHEVHLWLVRPECFEDAALIDRYKTCLNDEEIAKSERFRFDHHRQQYIVTRALVRHVLSLYHSTVEPADWQFERNDYGRPRVDQQRFPGSVEFNVSHTDGMIIMGVSQLETLGVDVENIHRKGATLKIADRYFSRSEVKDLFSLNDEAQQKKRFFDVWTLKEAYIKACGMGLSIPLDSFSYGFDQEDQVSLSFSPERDDDASLWQLWRLKRDDFQMAVAAKGQTLSQIQLYEVVPGTSKTHLASLGLSRQNTAI